MLPVDDCSFLRVSALSAVKISASRIISVEGIHVTGLLFTSKASGPNDQRNSTVRLLRMNMFFEIRMIMDETTWYRKLSLYNHDALRMLLIVYRRICFDGRLNCRFNPNPEEQDPDLTVPGSY